MKDLLEQIFKVIDKKDAAGFVKFLTEDALFKFGNAQTVAGKVNIENAVLGFFSSIEGLKHRIVDVWMQDGVIICEGEVTYTRKDHYELTLPFTDIFRMKNGLICDYRIYMDISPLFA